jgi:hypothetical protein
LPAGLILLSHFPVDAGRLISHSSFLEWTRGALLLCGFCTDVTENKEKNWIHWVHPINEKREEVGLFYTLFQDLRKDEKSCFNYFRMYISTFGDLHERLKDNLQRQNTTMTNCIQPVQMVATALR